MREPAALYKPGMQQLTNMGGQQINNSWLFDEVRRCECIQLYVLLLG